jgi:hypothetical protein
MEREMATQWQDLPHTFRPTTQLRATREITCDCGRALGDELHGERARELARDYSTPTLQTEKGI